MRLLRNLPLSTKLYVPAFAVLVLLVGLAGSVLLTMARLDALQVRVSEIGAADARLDDMRMVVQDMHASLRDVLSQHTPKGLANVADRIEAERSQAKTLLADLRGGTIPQAAEASVARIAAGLERYGVTLSDLQRVRNQAVQERDTKYRPAVIAFTQTLRSVLSGASSRADATHLLTDTDRALTQYATAAEELRAAMLDYFVTDNASHIIRIDTAGIDMTEAMAGMLATPPIELSMLRRLDAAGRLMRDAASRTLQLTIEAAGPLRTQANAAAQDLASELKATESVFTAAVGAARAEALAAAAAARLTIIALTAGASLIVLVAGLVIIRAIAPPFARLDHSVRRIAAGDVAFSVPDQERGDEIGRIAASLERLRLTVARAFVQSQMIEQLPVGVVLCEPGGANRITYGNAETRRLLAGLPHMAADDLAGQDPAGLAPDAVALRDSLASPDRLPYGTRAVLGAETVDLRVTALRYHDGSYAGPMVTLTGRTEQARLVQRFEQTVGSVVTSISQAAETVADTAADMDDAAADSGARATAVAAAGLQVSSSVDSVAATTQQLAVSVSQVAQRMTESTDIAAQLVAEAAATDLSVADLNTAADRIGGVVRLIGSIAARTNLLALNATIEAARAGDAGRGFAVVAGEVKTLAGQTAAATAEVGAQIAAMQAQTAQAAAALRRIGATIKRLDEIATTVAGAVEDQGTATAEIATTIHQVAAGTLDLVSHITEAGEVVAQTRNRSGVVLQATAHLNAEAGRLREDVAGFLHAMQEAA